MMNQFDPAFPISIELSDSSGKIYVGTIIVHVALQKKQEVALYTVPEQFHKGKLIISRICAFDIAQLNMLDTQVYISFIS